jgi:hypothetical protein
MLAKIKRTNAVLRRYQAEEKKERYVQEGETCYVLVEAPRP